MFVASLMIKIILYRVCNVCVGVDHPCVVRWRTEAVNGCEGLTSCRETVEGEILLVVS